MKLYTFEINQQRRVGAEWAGRLVDLTAAYNFYAASLASPPTLRALPSEMGSIVRLGQIAIDAATQTIDYLKNRPASAGADFLFPLGAVRILAPIRPGKILCALPGPGAARFAAKLPNAVIGPGEAIVKPRMDGPLGFALELAVAIGKPLKGASEAEAIEAVFGYTILNDLWMDAEPAGNRDTLGRNYDTFGPLGPYLVTHDEFSGRPGLAARSLANGQAIEELRLEGAILAAARLLSALSAVMTLEPGDLLGMPIPGSGPPIALNAGDVVALEIEGIGRLENPVVGAA